jgi:hypothetical protein
MDEYIEFFHAWRHDSSSENKSREQLDRETNIAEHCPKFDESL